MKSIQTRQIAASFAKALKEELVLSTKDERIASKAFLSFYKVTSDLIRVLKEVHREDLFLEVFEGLKYASNRKEVEEDFAFVLSSVELNDRQVDSLKKALKKKLGADIKIKVVIDESIEGGLLVKYKDMEIDLRAGAKLKKFLQNFNKD